MLFILQEGGNHIIRCHLEEVGHTPQFPHHLMRIHHESIQHFVHKVTVGDLISIQRFFTCEGLDMSRENLETHMKLLGRLIFLHVKVVQCILCGLVSCHLKRTGAGLGNEKSIPHLLGIGDMKKWCTCQLIHSSFQEPNSGKVEVSIKHYTCCKVVWINGIIAFPGVDEVPHGFTHKPKIICHKTFPIQKVSVLG